MDRRGVMFSCWCHEEERTRSAANSEKTAKESFGLSVPTTVDEEEEV